MYKSGFEAILNRKVSLPPDCFKILYYSSIVSIAPDKNAENVLTNSSLSLRSVLPILSRITCVNSCQNVHLILDSDTLSPSIPLAMSIVPCGLQYPKSWL